ncbi:bile acid:sodium symporter family protein [Bythopirellula goksoeyrii]|uniref:Sodium Bile acid symporter family protein n=1 Tax=Bythopirellula goksoeyrii TaxID=1400387 RepID=A0A5B9Q6I0_9BACT|nr:bile acid:sodium symporter [Bythopirellula goksoeyrii]QEG33022.1 Sodium Bile acid symporter family protein [Bythopirellula goksoeyrii]
MINLWKRHWFLILLGIVLLVGMAFPYACSRFAFAIPKNWVIAVVLMLMALPLHIDAMWNAVRRPGPAFLAVAINAIVVPLLAWPLSFLLKGELAIGLVIAAAVPSTIASATVWTRLAGGNEAISIMVTVVTNLACFLVTPAWVWFIIGRVSKTEPFSEMAIKLLLIVVLPIMVAQLLRLIPGVSRFATEKKPLLSILAQAGLLSIVLLGAVHAGMQLTALHGKLAGITGQIALMMVLAATVHVVAWFLGYRAGGWLRYSPTDSLAVAFSGSQKTLMVGLAIALEFGGLAILPMLAYHIEQLLIDTLLAGRYQVSDLVAEHAPD